MAHLGVAHITMTGGHPLFNPHVFDFIKHVGGNGRAVRLDAFRDDFAELFLVDKAIHFQLKRVVGV